MRPHEIKKVVALPTDRRGMGKKEKKKRKERPKIKTICSHQKKNHFATKCETLF